MNDTTAIVRDFSLYMPEVVLGLGAMALLLFGVFREKSRTDVASILAIVILIAAAVLVLFQGDQKEFMFRGSFVNDQFSQFMKSLTIAGSAVVLYMSLDYWRNAGVVRSEYPVLILFATTGMLMMISANDLIALYLGLELQSLALYVIAAFRRDSRKSSEAGLKYFVLGALSSGMLLYGSSLVYGTTGATNFVKISSVIQSAGLSLGLIIGLVFIVAGLAFKISAVPFHMWTPDVYEGAPTPVTAFFAAAPKVAAMAMFVRVVLGAFPAITTQWQQIIVFISIASMVLGAFGAIGQNNIKRLMAYSSIGHMGFALVGLAAGSQDGTQGLLIYMTIYLVTTLGTFACILAMRRGDSMVEDIDQLAGLSRTDPTLAFVLGALLFSLAGIPWLAGFFAKFYVFLAAIRAGLYPLAVIGVLASVVAAFYYLRIVKIMFFDDPVDPFDPTPFGVKLVLVLSGLFVLAYIAYPSPLVGAAEAAARSLF